MVTTITSQYKKVQDGVLTGAHKILLAGLGAASLVEERGSKLFDDGRGLLDEGNKVFEDLVERGEKLETEGKKRFSEMKTRTESTLDDLQSDIDERVEKAVERLGIPHRNQIRVLAKRVEDLTRQVESFRTGKEIPAPRSVYHLLPMDGEWSVKAEDEEKPLSTHRTKDAALSAARELALATEPSKLVVHRLDGTIQTSYSYGDED